MQVSALFNGSSTADISCCVILNVILCCIVITGQLHMSRGLRMNSGGYRKVFDSLLVKVDLRSNLFSIFHGQKFLLML